MTKLGIADGDGGGESAADLRAGVEEIEEDAVGVAEPVLMENGFVRKVNGDAGDGTLGPITNVRQDNYFCKRRSR